MKEQLKTLASTVNKYMPVIWDVLAIFSITLAVISLFDKNYEMTTLHFLVSIYANSESNHLREMKKLDKIEKKIKQWRVDGFGE